MNLNMLLPVLPMLELESRLNYLLRLRGFIQNFMLVIALAPQKRNHFIGLLLAMHNMKMLSKSVHIEQFRGTTGPLTQEHPEMWLRALNFNVALRNLESPALL